MNSPRRKKALVVDDSAFMRKLISDFLKSHPDIEVVGTARNGQEAIEKVKLLQPDVVTMDIEMPVMNGLEALQEIMETNPVPIIMLSSTTKEGAENTILAMEYGAVDFVAKPGGAISLNLHEVKEEIVRKVAIASGVQLANLKKRSLREPFTNRSKTSEFNELAQREGRTFFQKPNRSNDKLTKNAKTIVLVGTSTGGPRALQEVLTRIPSTIEAPIVIVQHMPAGFTQSLANRLDGLCDITVKEAEDGDHLVNGTAYIAPGGKHIKLKKLGECYSILLDDNEPPRMGHRPSVDVLLESAAEQKDVQYVSVIMTGMGSDGKRGMSLLKKNGQTKAIAESENTSIVYGMPKAIVESGMADEVLDLCDIADSIVRTINS